MSQHNRQQLNKKKKGNKFRKKMWTTNKGEGRKRKDKGSLTSFPRTNNDNAADAQKRKVLWEWVSKESDRPLS